MIDKIERKSLSDNVKEILINAILERVYKPGDRIKEIEIAKKLGVSQSPVREALRKLVSIGFLESEPYKGTIVSEFSIEKLKEVYKVRASLECLAIIEARKNIKREDLDFLENIINKMIGAAEKNNYQEQAKYDVEFHKKIINLSRNSMLKKAWNSLGVVFWTYVGINKGKVSLKNQAQKHKEILELLINKDMKIDNIILFDHFSEP